MRKIILLIILSMIIIFTLSNFAAANINYSQGVFYYKLEDNTEAIHDWTITEHNGPTYMVAKVGNGVNLSLPSSQYLSKTSMNGSEIASIRTVDLWINPDLVNGNEHSFFSLHDGVADNCDHFDIMIQTDNKIRVYLTIGCSSKFIMSSTTSPQAGNWMHIIVVMGTGGAKLYINGNTNPEDTDASTDTTPSSFNNLILGNWNYLNYYFDGIMDNVYTTKQQYNTSHVTQSWNNGNGYIFGDSVLLNISDINCTSCNPPNGDIIPPYTTSDTTPTFTFNSGAAAYCRISDKNYSYSQMGETRDCNEGGTQYHTCTLTTQDELIYSNSSVYITCVSGGDEDSSGRLEMEITNLEINSTQAIQRGIEGSNIWPGATIYTDQQVYLRDLNNNQILGTVDKVAVYGNQRWLLNYGLENEGTLGLFNLTPVVYSWDKTNVSLTEIQSQISALINNTKS